MLRLSVVPQSKKLGIEILVKCGSGDGLLVVRRVTSLTNLLVRVWNV